MGDQDMATFDDVDWADDTCMDECDLGAPLNLVAEASADRYADFSHAAFVNKLRLQILPNDLENCEGFDKPTDFRIGDPNVHFHAAAAKPYDISGDTGKPEWGLLFGFILSRMSHLRFLSTVYVLVDNRDLTNLDNPDPSLQHWPAVAAWWSSRACMQGPARELCDVVYFLISHASGLHLVDPTWAGTFVLAALCLVFPGLHIVLDSDCVPVTLFEVEDLWQEAQRLQHVGFPGPVPTSSCAGGLNLDQAGQSSLSKPKEQGVILVTEHNAELNAGFAVLRGSNHAPPLLEEDWQSIPLGRGELQDLAIGKYQQQLVTAYWQLVSTMVSHGRDDRNMTPSECQAWIQTGLALTPFCGHVMNTWNGRSPGPWWENGLPVQYSCPANYNGQGKDIPKLLSLRMINGQPLCSRGLELVLNKDHFLPCLPFLGMPLSWSSLEMACSKRSELSMASVDR